MFGGYGIIGAHLLPIILYPTYFHHGEMRIVDRFQSGVRNPSLDFALLTGRLLLIERDYQCIYLEIIFAFYESVRRHARIELPLTGVLDNPFLSMRAAGAFAQKAGPPA